MNLFSLFPQKETGAEKATFRKENNFINSATKVVSVFNLHNNTKASLLMALIHSHSVANLATGTITIHNIYRDTQSVKVRLFIQTFVTFIILIFQQETFFQNKPQQQSNDPEIAPCGWAGENICVTCYEATALRCYGVAASRSGILRHGQEHRNESYSL